MKSYSSTTSTHLQTPPVTCRITRSGITAAPEWGTQRECPKVSTSPGAHSAWLPASSHPGHEAHSGNSLPAGPQVPPTCPWPWLPPMGSASTQSGNKLLTLRGRQVPESLRCRGLSQSPQVTLCLPQPGLVPPPTRHRWNVSNPLPSTLPRVDPPLAFSVRGAPLRQGPSSPGESRGASFCQSSQHCLPLMVTLGVIGQGRPFSSIEAF